MSFYYALSGIWSSFREEMHLRFHFMIAVLIMIFAAFYGISNVEWAVLILDIGAVFALELMNTATERAVDTATDKILPSAKLSKDAAAGAVLVLAIVSIAVGFCLFGNFDKIVGTLAFIFSTPKNYLPCIAVGVILLLLVIFGGKNGKKV